MCVQIPASLPFPYLCITFFSSLDYIYNPQSSPLPDRAMQAFLFLQNTLVSLSLSLSNYYYTIATTPITALYYYVVVVPCNSFNLSNLPPADVVIYLTLDIDEYILHVLPYSRGSMMYVSAYILARTYPISGIPR